MHTEHERCGTNNILQRLYETTHLRMNPAFSLLGLLGSALHMLLTLQTVSSATCLKHPPSRHPPRSRVLDRKGNPLYRSRSCTENRDHNLQTPYSTKSQKQFAVLLHLRKLSWAIYMYPISHWIVCTDVIVASLIDFCYPKTWTTVF